MGYSLFDYKHIVVQLVNEKLFRCFFSVFLAKKTERMWPIHSVRMERFYEGADSKSSIYVCLCAAVTHTWRGTCVVFVLQLKIMLTLFRSQCKCSHCGNQSSSPESRSCVKFCCLITGCPWQQRWTSVPLDLICHQHVVSANVVLPR